MRSLGPLQKTCVALVMASTASLSLGLGAHAQANDAVQAVWKQQEVSFAYRSGGAVHTCRGLRTQVRTLLKVLGANEATTVTTVNCDDRAGAHEVQIAFASPFEATPDNIIEATSQDATARLVARVRGEQPAETVATFPAQWKTISFANAMHLRLSPADCELLRQLRRDVMPRLAVRVIRDRMRCESDLGSGNRPQLVVAALVATPAPRTRP